MDNNNYEKYTTPGLQDYPYDPYDRESQKHHSRTGRKRFVALALICSLIGGLIGAGGMALGLGVFAGSEPGTASYGQKVQQEAESQESQESKKSTETMPVIKDDATTEKTASEVYEQNVDSTVAIKTSVMANYFGYQTTGEAAGSGFILTEDGYIATNYHVVENASSITVMTHDGESHEAELVGYDEGNDLAVLKIEASELKPVTLGDSSDMRVGDDVVAIGNPLGELSFSLTSGSISAIGREVTIDNLPMNLIQTDCAINAGNSGGALFNMYGKVIGITNAKYSGSGSSGEASVDNIAFAIPIDSVKDILTGIIEKGYYAKPYIGVTISDLGEEYEGFGLPGGAVVQGVLEDSPAKEAGLKKNDIITKVNDEKISGSSELKNCISKYKAGDVLTLTVYRQGKTLTIKVKGAEQKQDAVQKQQESQNQQEPPQGNDGSGTIPGWGQDGNGFFSIP